MGWWGGKVPADARVSSRPVWGLLVRVRVRVLLGTDGGGGGGVDVR